MQVKPFALLALSLSILTAVGCSKKESASSDTSKATESATPAPVSEVASIQRAKACELVTQDEMSTILGHKVTGTAGGNERPPSATECIYSSAEGAESDAELEIDWGGGDPQTLDTATGLVNSVAPAVAADSLKGLGERAYKVTADQVFISTSGNLMMVRFSPGSTDVNAKARRIYEIAKSRMK
jgi:hypothetical protein